MCLLCVFCYSVDVSTEAGAVSVLTYRVNPETAPATVETSTE